MRKVTKRIALLLAGVMLAGTALTGCALKGGSDSASGGADVLKLGVVDKGYGDAFVEELAKAFEAKTGIKTVLDKSSSADWIENTLKAGAKNNDIDVFFDINPIAMKNVATKNYLEGYDRAYVDLSDIYDATLEGYSTEMTLEEAALPYSLTACTWGGEDAGYGDGKQYFVNWAAGVEGIVYNKALFEKYKLDVPKTSDELLALMKKMTTLANGDYAKNSDGYDIFPIAYSGKANYLNYPAAVWWAQYDGIDGYNYALQGKDAGGNYTAESVKTIGKLSAMNIVSEMMKESAGFADPGSQAQNFTNAQVLFLSEAAFMMSTGDWIEREMSSNFDGNMEIAFMKIPVNSAVINNCDSIKNDKQLAEVVAFIDGDTDKKPGFVSDADLEYITSARKIYCSEGNQHIAYIPAYSNNIEAAKQFLSFMMSKEGQEIVLEHSYGNMAPLNIPITEFDYGKKLSTLAQSKFEILNVEGGAQLVGNNYVHPMAYAGGLVTFLSSPTMENAFGVVENSESYMTPQELWQAGYDKVAGDWSDKMATAGVTN